VTVGIQLPVISLFVLREDVRERVGTIIPYTKSTMRRKEGKILRATTTTAVEVSRRVPDTSTRFKRGLRKGKLSSHHHVENTPLFSVQ